MSEEIQYMSEDGEVITEEEYYGEFVKGFMAGIRKDWPDSKLGNEMKRNMRTLIQGYVRKKDTSNLHKKVVSGHLRVYSNSIFKEHECFKNKNLRGKATAILLEMVELIYFEVISEPEFERLDRSHRIN
jgi:hypothetical protein